MASITKKPTATEQVGSETVLPSKTRTSVITKSIKRTLLTAQFETLVIEDGIEEIIEWSDLNERNKKIDNWELILLQRFKMYHDKILEELGLQHKMAYFKNPNESTINKYKDKIPIQQAVMTTGPAHSPHLQQSPKVNLDALDVLEQAPSDTKTTLDKNIEIDDIFEMN